MLDDCLIESTVYENGRPSDVSAYVRRHIGMHELKTEGVSAQAKLRHATLGNLGLSVISYGARTTVENAQGIDSYHLQLVLSGTCEIQVNHQQLTLTTGNATFINPGVPSAVTYSADCTKLIVNIPESLFRASSVDRLGGGPNKGVRFMSDVYEIGIKSSVAHAIEQLYIEADEHVGRPRLAQTPLELFFAAKMLDFFPNSLDTAPPDDFAQRIFSVIDTYIDNHIKYPIGAAELASCCNISQRTLYDRFTLLKGVTPSAYVKEKKLRRIYAHLSDPAADVRNVTEMALDYGFNHLGRFSADFKAVFAESPSETFRRVRTGK